MSTVSLIKLVAEREIKVKLRDKGFIISTLVLLLFVVGSIALPALFANDSTTVATADSKVAAQLTAAGHEVTKVADDAAATQLVRDDKVEAAVTAGPTVVGLTEVSEDVARALVQMPRTLVLAPNAVDPGLGYLVTVAMGVLFFILSMIFGMQIAQSVVEEKQTRIVEILVSAVPVRALLAGKIIAISILAFAQVALITAVAIVGGNLAGVESALLAPLTSALGWFLPFFVVGFVMLAALWAAVGALVSRIEDLGSASTPVNMLLMIPWLVVTYTQDNATLQQIMSYVPLSSPIAMPARVFNGTAAIWEPIVALVLLLAAAGLTISLGARIYQGSLMRTNGRTSWKAAWASKPGNDSVAVG